LETIAGWIAPIATAIAAIMTAANLGPRVTGWGFVVFAIGSVGWCTVALMTGQQNLLWTNGFLTFVNLIGIWRWLGREARLDDGAEAAREKSEQSRTPDLFSVTAIEGQAILGRDGAVIARAAGAMAERASGRIAYLVVREGDVAGVGGRLHALDWDAIDPDFKTGLDPAALRDLREVDATDWPAMAPAR
jgi:hypothetical protein